MKHEPTGKDPLERLLGSQPVQPSPGFTEQTLARLRAEGTGPLSEEEFDRRLDAWLADMPLEPGRTFAVSVMEEARRPQERRLLGLPAWVSALGGIAAVIAIGAFAAVSVLTDTGSPQPTVATLDTSRPTTAVATPLAAQPSAPGELDNAPDFLFVASADNRSDNLSDLILMQDALFEVAALSDQTTIEALDLLVN
jgi:hypothetical protein